MPGIRSLPKTIGQYCCLSDTSPSSDHRYNHRPSPNTVIEFSVRRLLCIFLMLMLPLPGFAMQGGTFALKEMFDIAHELEHIEGASHHHDEHGATHYDDSGESAKHFAEHSASSPCIALVSDIPSLPAPELFKAARSDLGQYIPDHIPERPQRPPQSLG